MFANQAKHHPRMQSPLLVTIGIPTYNRADGYLRETLESALAQTYPNIEIVVSDNASPDNTQEVVRGYADSRIRYFRQDKGLIPNENFNFCLQQANGVYFLLLHDDDKIDSDFIDTCLRAAHYRDDVGVILTATRIINAEGTVIHEGRNAVAGLSTGEFFLAWIKGKTSLYLCNTLYNTKALKASGGFRSKHNLFQDVMATAKLAASHGRIDIDALKASARQHGGKWTHVARVQGWCEDSLELLDLMCELAPDKQAELRKQGGEFFANVNFNRATDIRSPLKRAEALLLVYRLFGRRYLPSWRLLFQSTALYRVLRDVKRKVLGQPAWVE